MRLDTKRPSAVKIPPSYGTKQREGVHFRFYDEITPGVREESKPMSIYMWADEPHDNYFAKAPEVGEVHAHAHAHEQGQARRSPSPASPGQCTSEAAPLKVSPGTQKRRRSSIRELPARALAYFGRAFGSGSSGGGGGGGGSSSSSSSSKHDVKKGRAFRPGDERTELQSPRVAVLTGTLSSCSSPYSSSTGYAEDGMDVELNGLGGPDVHLGQMDVLDVLSPRPALPAEAVAGGSVRGRKAQANEEDGLQSPKVDVYSRASLSDRHQTRPRAWSRDRSGRGSGMGCDSRNAGRRGRGRPPIVMPVGA